MSPRAMLDDLKMQFGTSLTSVRRLLERPVGMNWRRPVTSRRQEQHRRLDEMRHDLHALLGLHEDSRSVMRHLGMVERVLEGHGLAGVEALPVRVIDKALTQLEKLVWDWSSPGLAELRSRMAIIVRERGHELPEPGLYGTLSLQIKTDGVTDLTAGEQAAFEEMERSWAGRMPEGAAEALALAKAGG